jgi:selenocysteine-specific elongation factor
MQQKLLPPSFVSFGNMKHLILGTAGHVDHGKTSLIKAMTDVDCDTHKAEKERGITINLGFTHLNLPSGNSLGIVDVPGHKDFIKTMVAGAYGIDLVMLVVAADSGIMPQTLEHIRIIELLGVKHAIVALNKADLVDDEMLELAELDVTEMLEHTNLKEAPIVPVSSVTGSGINELVKTIDALLDKISERKTSNKFRMYIDRIFNVKGIGFVVTGSVLEGEISIGKDLYLLPGKSKKVKVRGLQRHGVDIDKVVSGDRAAINLSGLKFEDFKRGMVLSNAEIAPTDRIDATCTLFESQSRLELWTNGIFYSGTFESAVRVHLLDKDQLQGDETAIVQIHLERPAILADGDKFILRNSSNTKTYGGGTIIDVFPLHHKRRTDKLIRELSDLVEAMEESDRLIHRIRIETKKINRPVEVRTIASLLEVPESIVISECKGTENSGIVIFDRSEPAFLLTSERHQDYRQFILEEIRQWHERNPILEEGLEPGDFFGKLGFNNLETGKTYVEQVLQTLQAEGHIKKARNTWALKTHKGFLDDKTKEQLNWLSETIRNVGLEKPNPSEISTSAHAKNINKEKLKMMLKYLGDKGTVVFHEGEYIHSEIVDVCRKKLLQRIESKPDGINEKDFRELIGGTRKLIQLLLGIFTEEGTVIKPTFYIMITDKGKTWLSSNR